MRLIEPTDDMKIAFSYMVEDYKQVQELRYQETFEAYMDKVERYSKGENLKTGHVPSITFWLIDDNEMILGVSRLRQYLVSHLEKEGGHIGYDVPPSLRRKGYGSMLLKLTLRRAKELGMDKVLVTCDRDNIGSSKVIENNGGKLENEVISDSSGKKILRYWIEL